ncbi:hypothetical protein EJB05_55624, partial [Eragrostis curvula]
SSGVKRFHIFLAAAAAAAFRVPSFSAPFGIEAVPAAEYCFRRYGPGTAAPFALSTAAAIHLGNTKSCIAGYGSGDHPPRQHQGTLSGEAALKHVVLSPGTAISGITRLLHRRLGNAVVKKEMELVPYNFTEHLGWASILVETGEGKAISAPPHHLAGILISELKRMAEAHLGREVKNAVIALPRHVTHDGRDSVVFSATGRDGFRVARVVDEQIAAAAAHGHHTKQGDGKVVLVFHVGGRTSHATLFKFVKGSARQINQGTVFVIAGDDFTSRVVDYFVELIKQQHGIDIRHDKMALLRLREECERAKKALSEQEETLVHVEVDGVDLSAPLTRAKFEELNHYLFERAMALLDWVLMNAQVVEKKHKTVRQGHGNAGLGTQPRGGASQGHGRLVGGSARIPKVGQLVKDYFHGRELNRGLEPDETVIHGAVLLTRPEATRYLEPCFHHWHEGDPRFI